MRFQFCDFIKITLRHGCSPVNSLYIFRVPFPKNTSRGLLLTDILRILSDIYNVNYLLFSDKSSIINIWYIEYERKYSRVLLQYLYFSLGRTKRSVEDQFFSRHNINIKATLKGCNNKGALQRQTNTYNMCNECIYEIELPAK